jgi:hypothetical protein
VLIRWQSGIPTIEAESGIVAGSASAAPLDAAAWYCIRFSFPSGSFTSVLPLLYPDGYNGTGGVYAWGAQLGDAGAYIPTTDNGPATVTDYSLDQSAGCAVVLDSAPELDAVGYVFM